MMRAPTNFFPIPTNRLPLVRPLAESGMLALAIATSAVASSAQNSPNSFSLPAPSPTPTPAPQGPLDERAGVPIAPRVIPERQPTIEPAPTSTQPAAPTPAPTQSVTPVPAPRESESERRLPSPRTNTTQTPATNRTTPSTQVSNGPVARPNVAGPSVAGPSVAEPGISGPGFGTELIPDDGEGPIGPDDWYAVTPDGETGSAAESNISSSTAGGASSPVRDIAATGADAIRSNVSIGLALMGLLSIVLGWLFWRRRKQDQIETVGDGPSLAYGVHKAIAQTLPSDSNEPQAAPTPQPTPAPKPAAAPKPDPVEPKPQKPTPSPPPVIATPPGEPARVDLGLEIAGGSRSLMMFSIDFRLDIANRSDSALRHLNVSGQLVCAQHGDASAAPVEGRQLIEAIERIGPQQSRRVSGQLQLPLNEVKMIRQGSKPLFIPLLHITIEASGQLALKRSFVIGNPSANSQSRVHPLPLDGPPGGLPSLRAQLIKQPQSRNTKTAKSPTSA